ncbi:centromere protein J [Fopius arisanus]|uniref:Cenpj_0 protein n=1 Tax=Fopius arisanus TaxID=64838 RepID=A0A0C9RJA1_9HYME|nr:PREDICTED: centromere protein J [Fopius arisanus]
MDLEASIIERLQELRKWQLEQQEKLLQQQHEQREQLTIEQERMFEALGLKDMISDDSILDQLSTSTGKVIHSPVKQSNDCRKVVHSPVKHLNDSRSSDLSRCSSPMVTRSTTSERASDLEDRPLLQLSVPALRLTSSSSGLSSFSSPRNIQSHNPSSDHGYESEKIVETPRGSTVSSNVSVEGVEPLPVDKSVQKCLTMDDVPVPSPKKDFNTLLEERLRDSPAVEESHNDQKKVIKRPFLKRGEGLARFKPNPNGNLRSSTRPRSASLSAMGYTQNTKNSGKNKDTPKSSRAHTSRRSAPSIPPVPQKLNLKAVPPPQKKVRSKSLSAAVPSPPKPPRPTESTTVRTIKSGDDSNPSDLDSSKLETKMFEFLEEKAENSSFCSTSSAVIAFMQQSTPLKLRSIKQKLSTQTVSPSKLKQGSPIRAIRETVVQKDIVISQWDSGPFPEDNTPALAFTNSQRDIKKIVGDNFQGSQETNAQILLYNNNNVEEFKNVESDSNVSTSTEMDSTLEEKSEGYPGNNKETNVSMHVRFAEYNEYKTIGLTDTSMISTDSRHENYGNNYRDKLWSESASSESSDHESFKGELPQNVMKTNQSSYNRSNVKYPSKPKLLGSMQPRNLQDYEDSTDHSTDEEHSVLNDSEGTYYDDDNTISELQEAVRKTMESYNEKVKELSLEDIPPARAPGDHQDLDEGTIFKSELLKTRLLELEREIDIFRRENTKLAAEKEKLEEEHRRRLRELREKEDNLEKERIRMETSLQEEKKRIVREKSALESRLKDAREKSIQTKQERQEAQVLKEQLEELRDEMNEKEQRWQAAQARQKSQMRVLQMENTKLRQDLERVQSAKRGPARLKRPGTMSNTKAIHQINRQLDGKRSAPKKSPEPLTEDDIFIKSGAEIPAKINLNIDKDLVSSNDTGKVIVYETSQRAIPTEEEIEKRRNMYQDLLKEAASGFKGHVIKKSEERTENDEVLQKENTEVLSGPPIVPRNFSVGKEGGGVRTSTSPSVLKSTENIESRGSYQQFVREVLNPRIESRLQSSGSSLSGHHSTTQEFGKIDSQEKSQISPPGVRFAGVDTSETDLIPRQQSEHPLPKPVDSLTPRQDLVSISQLSELSGQGVSPQKQQVREVLHPDGYTEYWYPNGNVKKVFPDRNITKMIYYNGDVRETTEEGCIKYFYAATKTWHTTYPDGFEILEFPDGQEERRTTDGVIEVSFPDGSIRLMQPDGVEKWVLPDGTVAETFPNGEKILSLPNGQREVHTKDHKRREYPDGTVKYVYPDGTQETRYSNGRIRVKDKDGNLLRDSHQS